ncbi:hypothetical protein DFQ28_004001, partial [Apophysomyces sp. BC1034]
MSNDETVTEYGNRFQNACRDSGVQDNEGIATRFLHSLTPSVQTNVRIAWTAQHGKKLPQKIEEVLDITSMVSLGKRIRRSDDEHSPSHPKKNHKKDTKFWCPHHKKQVNHRPQDCRLAKGDAEMTMAEKRYKAGQCIHCGIQWFKGHTCDEYHRAHHDKHQRRVTKDKKVNIIQPANTGNVTEPAHTGIVTEPAHTGIDEHPADSLMDEIDAELEAEFQASGMRLYCKSLNDNPFLLKSPILIQNKRYQGLIDTGAEISVINRKICLANKWHFSSVSGKIHYAGKGHSVNHIGITELLEIKYNNRTITHQFE